MTPARAASVPIIARTAATSSGRSAPAISAAATATARSIRKNSPASPADDQIKMVELKISQGAKPGHGGVLPAAKVSEEISKIRGVAMGEDCISPATHRAFSTPLEMMAFIAEMRRLSGGKPAGFKLCIGHPWEFLAICKAMLETGIYPDFIVVDGNEGGTGAAPLEFMDHLGMPMREGVNFVHNALIGINARDRIRIGAAGKIATAFDMARAMAIGADWCNSARGFMFSLGCIQSLSCHTDRCPTGVTTQDPLAQPRAGGAAQDRAGLQLPSRHPARAGRASRRRRARTSAADLRPIHFSQRTSTTEVHVVREALSVAAPGRIDRRHQRSALPRRLGMARRTFAPAGVCVLPGAGNAKVASMPPCRYTLYTSRYSRPGRRKFRTRRAAGPRRRDRSAVGVVGGVGDELIVGGQRELLVERVGIVGFEDSLAPVVELAVADQNAEPAGRDEVAMVSWTAR